MILRRYNQPPVWLLLAAVILVAGASCPAKADGEWGAWRTPASPPGGGVDQDDQTAAQVPLADAGACYAASNVETALAEIFSGASCTLPDARINGAAEADEIVLAGDVDGTANANDLDEAAVRDELEGVLRGAQLQGDVPLSTKTSGPYVAAATAGGGLTLTGSEGGTLGMLASCGIGKVLAWSGTAWACADGGPATYAGSASAGGPATTALALNANGTNCTSQAASGVDAAGNAEGCTSYVIPGSITSSLLTMSTSRLLGRSSASGGAIEEISVSGCTLSGGTLTCSSVSVPGSNTQCIFNDSGALGADSGCTYDKATGILTATKFQVAGAIAAFRNNGGYVRLDTTFEASALSTGAASHLEYPALAMEKRFELRWANDFDWIATKDLAIKRGAAGVAQFTDGNTGGGTIQLGDAGTKPTCDSTARFRIWHDAGGAGVADTSEICGKSAADTYSWVALATF